MTFTDTSTNTPTSWSWNFGDSSTSTVRNPSHTYTNAGSYTVALTATNVAGSNTRTQTGYINVTTAAPAANFSAAPTNGPVPLAVQFTDASTNAPTSWTWTFGDGYGSNLQNPSHTYTTAGDYTVSLTATNSGGSNAKTLTNYLAVANSGEAFAYPDTITTFPNPGVTLISGTLADLQTANGVYQDYKCDTTNQRYELMYTSHTGYTPSQVTNITIEYRAHSTRSDTPASGNVFVRQSNGSWPNVGGWVPTSTDTDYSWNTTAVSTYMDATGIVGFELCTCPTGGNSNNYDVLTDKLRFRLQLATPVADFSATPTSGLKSLAVTFTDASSNSPTAWSWNFGDSTTSTVRNPSHTYTTQGYKTVALTATNAVGSNTMTKTNYIRVFQEVSTYPSSWNAYSNAPTTVIAGGLSNLQADDSSYMQLRCDPGQLQVLDPLRVVHQLHARALRQRDPRLQREEQLRHHAQLLVLDQSSSRTAPGPVCIRGSGRPPTRPSTSPRPIRATSDPPDRWKSTSAVARKAAAATTSTLISFGSSSGWTSDIVFRSSTETR